MVGTQSSVNDLIDVDPNTGKAKKIDVILINDDQPFFE